MSSAILTLKLFFYTSTKFYENHSQDHAEQRHVRTETVVSPQNTMKKLPSNTQSNIENQPKSIVIHPLHLNDTFKNSLSHLRPDEVQRVLYIVQYINKRF